MTKPFLRYNKIIKVVIYNIRLINLTSHRVKYTKSVSVCLQASTDDYISRNVRKLTGFRCDDTVIAVNFVKDEINVT